MTEATEEPQEDQNRPPGFSELPPADDPENPTDTPENPDNDEDDDSLAPPEPESEEG